MSSTRQNLKISIFPALAISALLLFSGCFPGLAVWQKGDFYKVLLEEDYASRGIKNVGIYCFSQGGTWSYPGPHMPKSVTPDEVEEDGEVEPKAVAQAPSLALANECATYLTNKGYSTKVLTDKPHDKDIDVEELIKSAAGQGMDAVMVITYKGMTSWVKYGGSSTSGNIKTTKWTNYSGFLYLPSAAIFDCKKGDRVWSFQNYGWYENAHFINLFARFKVFSESSLPVEDGGKNYATAAPTAAKMLMEGPEYWPDTYVPIPSAQ